MRIVEARGDARLAFGIELITPGLCIVLMLLLVKPAEEPILEVESRVAQEKSVRMRDDVVLVVEPMNEDIVDHCIEKRRVGAGADARVDIRCRRGSGEPRVDVDDFRPIFLGLPDPLEGHGVVLRHIAAFHQNRLAMLQVNPVVGHRPAPERRPQTGDRGAMSKSGLMLDKGDAEKARGFLEEVALLVGVLCAAHERDRVRPVDGNLRVA